jgi:DNA-binding LacI/PurR family transcriptional regulator
MGRDSGTELKRLKMSDIARMCGVSTSTVSRALAGSPLIQEATREMIIEIADANGYVINPIARGLRLQRTNTIGVVFPLGRITAQLISDPFFQQMLGHMVDEISLRGYQILVSKVAPPRPGWLRDLIKANRTDGMVVIGQSDQHDALNDAGEVYQPLVVWGAHLPDQRYCVVGLDNVTGGRMAAEHLIGIGRRRIAFLGDPSPPEINQRRLGYLEAIRAAGLDVHERLDMPAGFSPQQAEAAAEQLLAENPDLDAIFAASDVIALSALHVLRRTGRRVPEDVAVVGFDDAAVASHSNPPLTTVRQDLAHAAKLMVEQLFRRLNGEAADGVTLRPELIIRQSSLGG